MHKDKYIEPNEVSKRLSMYRNLHNKYALQIGDCAVLDNEYHNSCEVKILGFTPSMLYTKVVNKGDNQKDAYMIMTNRLSPI